MFALAATIGVSMACSPAFAAFPPTHHPIVRGWNCSGSPALVRWENINGALWLQTALTDDGCQEGGFEFDCTGIPIQPLTFTAYYTGNDYEFYWYAYNQNDDYESGDFNYQGIPGHPGYYLTKANVPNDFSHGDTFTELGVEIYGCDVTASVLSTHWAIGSTPATADVHVKDYGCDY
jgi:hypothetical protein